MIYTLGLPDGTPVDGVVDVPCRCKWPDGQETTDPGLYRISGMVQNGQIAQIRLLGKADPPPSWWTPLDVQRPDRRPGG